MAYTNEEYQTYLKVRHELLLEDAREFLRAKLENADDRNVGIDDISEEEFEKYDFEYLVEEFERREDCNVAFNDTWFGVIEDYVEEEIDGWQSIGFYGLDENGDLVHWK